MHIRPMGERAALVTDLDVDPAGWAAAMRALAIGGVVEIVPAAETVLIACRDAPSLAAALDAATVLRSTAVGAAPSRVIEIPTRYQGPDLATVADASGMDVDAVVEAHGRFEYSVAFCGFAPGFAYLSGLDERLHLPRRSTPRTSVPPGSVAIADRYAAVYPRASPGGWHLLGTTDLVLFDADRTPPALLEPGMRVRFVAA